jgi:hypothetical protein
MRRAGSAWIRSERSPATTSRICSRRAASALARRARARFSRMNPAPKLRSASSWLCARQRSRRLSTVAAPPWGRGRMWLTSSRLRPGQRRPLAAT